MDIDEEIEIAKRALRDEAEGQRQRWLSRMTFLDKGLLPAIASERIGVRFDCGDHWMTIHLLYAPHGEALGTICTDGRLTEYIPPDAKSQPLIRFHDQAEQKLVFSDKDAELAENGDDFSSKVRLALVSMIAAIEIEAETA